MGSGLFITVMIASLLIVILRTRNDLPVFIALFTLAAVTVFSVGKAWIRLRAVRLALPQHDRELRRQFFPQITLWTITPVVFFYNCVAALLSRQVTWRGTTYEMVAHNTTRVLNQK